MSERTAIAVAVAERDHILATMDVEAAKRFMVEHGGIVPKGAINWVYVLHLARWEVASLPEPLRIESCIWLFGSTGRSLAMLSPRNRHRRVAMDLVSPKTPAVAA